MRQLVAIGLGIVLTHLLVGAACRYGLGAQLHLHAAGAVEKVGPHLDNRRQWPPRSPRREVLRRGIIQIALQNQAVAARFLDLPALRDRRAHGRAPDLLNIAAREEHAGFIRVGDGLRHRIFRIPVLSRSWRRGASNQDQSQTA